MADIARNDAGPWTQIPEPEPGAQHGRTAFGIEIEFNGSDRYEITDMLVAEGLPAVNLGRNVAGHWSMKDDCTVTGGELVSPVMDGSDTAVAETLRVLELVESAGAQTGPRVGLHMHFNVRDLTGPQMVALVRNFKAMDSTMRAFAGPDRDLGYNSPIESDSWPGIEQWAANWHERGGWRVYTDGAYCPPKGKHYAFSQVYRLGTVEVRLPGSTFSRHRARAWIRLVQAMIEAARHEDVIPDEWPMAWYCRYGLDQRTVEVFDGVLGPLMAHT